MIKPLIYLASPYSSDRSDIIERRVRNVQTATAKLIQQGNLIFSPIVHSHPICDQVTFSPLNTAEAMSGWTQYDHDFIDHCDEVWVLMIDGYDTSRGVSDEIAYAYANNIPVRFVSFPELVISAQTYSAFNPYEFADQGGTNQSLYGFLAETKAHIRVKDAPTSYSQADGHADEPQGNLKFDDVLKMFNIIRDEAVPLDLAILGSGFSRPNWFNTFLPRTQPVSIGFKIEDFPDGFDTFTKNLLDDLARDLDVLMFKNFTGEEPTEHVCDENCPPTKSADPTFVGAGSFYSPQSSGLPPAPKAPTSNCIVGTEGCFCIDTFNQKQTEETAEERTILKTSAVGKSEIVGREVSLPDDAADRESYPIAEGALYYFPNALAEVSKISKIGNDQHNPGEAMHWARSKSTNHADKIIRHLIDAGKTDANGNRHSAYMAWRALALLQVELENDLNLPFPKNAK